MKKKILLVGPVPPPYGGIPKYVNELFTSKFLNENYSISLFDTAIPRQVRRYDKDNRRSYLSFMSDGYIPALKLILYTFKNIMFGFTKKLKKFEPDIVQVFTSSYWGFWRNSIHVLISKLFGIKVYFHLLNAIDDFWDNSSFLGRYFISLSLNMSDGLIVQSNGIQKFVETISNTKVFSIYNGVKIELFSNSNQMRHDNKLDFFKVLFIGAINKNKGVYDIIKCAKLLKENVKIYLIGSCNIKFFEEILIKKDIGNMYFLGSVSNEEKIEHLKNSHLFILPSYAEGQPLSILEAMASGIPIISTKVGSIPEIIIDNVNGYIIEPGDAESLANYIDRLATDEELRQIISKNNMTCAKNLYNVDRMIIDISKLYE